MFASILRSAMFISLLLIVSVTLSGCSIDFGAIFDGIKTFIGNLSGNLGGFIEKGVGFVKNVISKAKEVVEPVVDIAKNLFGNTSLTADKVNDTLNKADETADKVGDVGGSLRDFSNKMNTTDAVGNKTGNAPTTAAVAPRDSEESKNTAAKDTTAKADKGNPFTNWLKSIVSNDRKPKETPAVTNITTNVNRGNAENSSISLPSSVSNNEVETLSTSEKEAVKENIKKEAEEIKTAMEKLNKEISSISTATSKDVEETKANLEKITKKIDEIIKDPLNEKSTNKIDDVADEIESVLNVANKYGDQAKNVADSFSGIFKTCESSFDSIYDDFKKIFNN